MGQAIAYQIGVTPGMELSFVADEILEKAQQAANVYGTKIKVSSDCLSLVEDPSIPCDVLVEATNSILPAYDYCMAAINRGAHCVLMNAEVDLTLGFLLREAARKTGVIVTSDAGDQHGVLSRMMEEIELWGFELIQAGNMKGYLDRYRTLAGSLEIAASLNLDPAQCLAYTDGSKLNIEMSIIANQYGFKPDVPGMRGPKAEKVEDVMELFEFPERQSYGNVEYILGAKQHRGGVYVVARCDNKMQAQLLDYYKVTSRPPFYLFFRPYHLCHIETTRAIAMAILQNEAVCTMRMGRVTDCFAYAKRDLCAGETIKHAIGSDEIYGLIDEAQKADERGYVPQALLDTEGCNGLPIIKRAIRRDTPIKWEDIDMPNSRLVDIWRQQQNILQEC